MTVFYTIDPSDDKEHIYFTAVGEEVEVTIPENFGTFPKNFSVMISLQEANLIRLLAQNANVDLQVDLPLITRPADLFYLINIDGFNTWKAIRAGNFALTTSNREIINAPKQLDTGSPIYQFIGTAGGSQDIILPDPPSLNDRFLIKNIFQNADELRIKETLLGSTILALGPSTLRYVCECIYDGTDWNVIAY